LRYGDLEVTDTVHVHVTDVKTGMVLEEGTIILKLLVLSLVANTVSVLLVFIDVVLESVQDVADVTPM
jgi:hypothetical protein|tara:strand:+ start:3322 stop:3525 length:204 start_codon:yes stop_codon:yes gene_type:complete